MLAIFLEKSEPLPDRPTWVYQLKTLAEAIKIASLNENFLKN
jgi:hypothetical protein